MTIRWKCERCGHLYDDDTKPLDDCCANCFGEPLVLVDTEQEPAAGLQPSPLSTPALPVPFKPSSPLPVLPETSEGAGLIEGLCVLACDASASMEDPAFPGESKAPKVKLVANAVQGAIGEMHNLSMNDTAYIAIIAFGKDVGLVKDREGRPFIKSVKDILEEYGDDLGHYLSTQFEDEVTVDCGGTNITGALTLAREIVDGAIAGSLREFGISHRINLIKHRIITLQNARPVVPNVRVMIYSDGAHNEGPLFNPFETLEPFSVLMTAFIGSEKVDEDTRTGAKQMKELANTCPIHGQKGYFLINSMARRYYLRQVFRMATKASGFCPQCLKEHAPILEHRPSQATRQEGIQPL